MAEACQALIALLDHVASFATMVKDGDEAAGTATRAPALPSLLDTRPVVVQPETAAASDDDALSLSTMVATAGWRSAIVGVMGPPTAQSGAGAGAGAAAASATSLLAKLEAAIDDCRAATQRCRDLCA